MPQMGYGTKTDRLTDRQSQCDFDFEPIMRHTTCVHAVILLGLFDPEDGGDIFLRNFG
jgi:hypothetical protein